MRGTIIAALLISSTVVACGSEAPQMVLEPPQPGLASDPRWLTFRCVEPGCSTTSTVTVHVLGERAVAVKRVILSDRDRVDFEIEPSLRPPFVLQPADTFQVTVTYRPDGDPRAADANLLVTFTDASASEEEMNRVPPGELQIPLVRRIVGTAELIVTPGERVFGAVMPGQERRLPISIANMGFGNVGMLIDRIEPGSDAVRVEALPDGPLLAGATHESFVIYAPSGEGYVDDALRVYTADSTKEPASVHIRATSIAAPKITVRPESGVDFGEVPVMTVSTSKLELGNFGSSDLVINQIEIIDVAGSAGLSIAFPGTATIAVVRALETVELSVTLDAVTPGNVEAFVRIHSNDPLTPVLDVPLNALVTEPRIEVSPPSIDFGAVPRGWTQVRSVELQNVGYGELTITRVGLILGSSDLFLLRSMPVLPIRLRHGQRAAIEIEFRSEVEAGFTATLSVDSNDASQPFVEVPIAAIGASCDAGCPIANGTPSCTGGTCEVGSCNPNWFDADLNPATGCECQEVSNEPGAFCADGLYVGTLVDEDSNNAVTSGVLGASDDVDVIRFHGKDEGFDVFDDAFDVRIRLESSDPHVKMCIYRKDTGDHLNECYWDNENCPGDRQYRRDGDPFDNDGADFIVKIFRDPGAPSACSPYTLFMSND